MIGLDPSDTSEMSRRTLLVVAMPYRDRHRERRDEKYTEQHEQVDCHYVRAPDLARRSREIVLGPKVLSAQ
jgi:hypothetical protein